MSYRTCPICGFQFMPEQHDQSICKLCNAASVFRARHASETIKKQERAIAREQRQCMICDRLFWPRTPAAKICHNDECKAEGRRRNDANRRKKKKAERTERR